MLSNVESKLLRERDDQKIQKESQLALLLFNEPEHLPTPLRWDACRQLDASLPLHDHYAVLVARGASPVTLAHLEQATDVWKRDWYGIVKEDEAVIIVSIIQGDHAGTLQELGQTLLQRLPIDFHGRVGGSDLFQGASWLRQAYLQAEIALQSAWYEEKKKSICELCTPS